MRAVVVVPARDEAQRIARCLRALAAQRGIARERLLAVVLVLDRCTDATEAIATAVAAEAGLPLRVERCRDAGVGAARRHGMDLACCLLGDDGLIATTDADSEVAPDWLAAQLALVAGGADAIGGRIELDPGEAAALPAEALARRERRARVRMRAVPEGEHHFFSGASIGVTVRAYREVGGLEPRAALEDEAFAARLTAAGLRIVRSGAVVVRTSARTDGRAGRGLARDLQLGDWLARRRHDGFAYTPNVLRAAKGDTTVSVVLPARDCAATIEGVLETTVMPFADAGLVDEVLVVDGRSADATASLAARAGATVAGQDDLLPEHGPALGKGDAMWRGVAATTGEIVAFLDADTRDPAPVHLLGLLGPLLTGAPEIQLVKGAFDRPFDDGTTLRPAEGGRVTELMARPLLNLHVPELAGFEQPLAGETAARRSLLETLPFPVGYGVEIAMLIDALRHAGLGALAEARLGTRQNDHQRLRDLGAMAFAVLAAVHARIGTRADAVPAGLVQPWAGGAVRDVPVLERPPLRQAGRGVDVLGAA